MSRERQQSELGEEVKCAKCGEFWPADSEFFFMNKGRPHSWCKACYQNDPKIIAKTQRFLDKASKQRQLEAVA
ncbi:hypothetical protein [Undibacterium curvum]|uniref:hypothetical protein n=1 Tax=Undibacterium curvum TaxID=2762294 RepID=UPI003D1343BB